MYLISYCVVPKSSSVEIKNRFGNKIIDKNPISWLYLINSNDVSFKYVLLNSIKIDDDRYDDEFLLDLQERLFDI